MFDKRTYGIAGLAALLMAPVFGAGPTFFPDKTFKGSSLAGWHTLGQADWHAQNGEITGAAKSGGGGPPVLYWYRTVRDKSAPGGARFEPELIHNRSGAGSEILAVDLNKDGAVDIATATDRGTFIFWGKPHGAASPAAAK
jgi:hypothetical protein